MVDSNHPFRMCRMLRTEMCRALCCKLRLMRNILFECVWDPFFFVKRSFTTVCILLRFITHCFRSTNSNKTCGSPVPPPITIVQTDVTALDRIVQDTNFSHIASGSIKVKYEFCLIFFRKTRTILKKMQNNMLWYDRKSASTRDGQLPASILAPRSRLCL